MNIIGYIELKGGFSFAELTFNEVDGLCFAQLGYTLLEPYFTNRESLTIKEASDLYFKDHTLEEIKESSSLIGQAPLVLQTMAKTDRFKDLKIHHFVSEINNKKVEQFCAMQINLDDKNTVIVFRGTDDTVVGWQEDFEMAYRIIPAQKRAVEYVNKYVNLFKNYYYLGHSKGGNLSAYAALHTIFFKRNRIKKIYSYDGPGINKDYYDEEVASKLEECYQKFIPEYDIFGTIFEDNEKCVVVKSSAENIFQHDAMSWLVDDASFVKAKKTFPESDIVRKGIAEFMNSVSIEQREKFVNEVFDALKELKLNNISDIYRAGLPAIIKTITKFIKFDKKSKEAGTKLINIFKDLIVYTVNDITNDAKRKIESIAKETVNFFVEDDNK